MNYIDHQGEIHKEQGAQDRLLSVLYTTNWGKRLVRLLVHPSLSKAAGRLLDMRVSKCLIGPFLKIGKLDMGEYRRKAPGEFKSYNDFFTRELSPGMRPVDMDAAHLPSPCDGKATVYPIAEDTSFTIKHTRYTVASLLRNEGLAKRYIGGWAVILRLCVTDYHRYMYPVSGKKSGNVFLPGVLHTVNPVAVETADVFKENAREFTLIRNQQFGTVLQMEVGALMVGRICNYDREKYVKRGEEKGKFEFGGSTVILLLQKDRVRIREDLLANTVNDCETEVRMGECIGEAYFCS